MAEQVDDRKYWENTASSNGGVLPDEFKRHPLTEDADFAYDMVMGTPQNINLFSKKVQYSILTYAPWLFGYITGDNTRTYNENDLQNIKDFAKDSVLKNPQQHFTYAGFAGEKYDILVKELIVQKPSLSDGLPSDFCDKYFPFILETLKKYPSPQLLRDYGDRPEVADIIKQYLSGELTVPKGTIFTKNPLLMYAYADKSIQNDYKVSYPVLRQSPLLYRYAGQTLKNDKQLALELYKAEPESIAYIGENLKKDGEMMRLYFTQFPERFKNEGQDFFNTKDEAIITAVLKNNIYDYRLFKGDALETETVQKVQKAMDYINTVYPSEEDNPNLNFAIVTNDDVMAMGLSVLNPLLDFDQEIAKTFTGILNKGEWQDLKKYINLTKEIINFDARTVYLVINTYEQMAALIKDLDGKGLTPADKVALRHIIETENALGINSYKELTDYPDMVKGRILSASGLEAKMAEAHKLCGCSLQQLAEITQTFPEPSKNNPAVYFFQSIDNADSEAAFDRLINDTDFVSVLQSPAKIKQDLKKDFEKMYRQSFLDVGTLQTAEIEDGVFVSDLKEQPFGFLIHRIFNFDRNLNGMAQQLLDNPEKWKSLNGATYISTSFINDKSVKGVFRDFTKGSEWCLGNEALSKLMKVKTIKDKYFLNTISEGAVFLGFTQMPDNALIAMDSGDMMTEHGGKKQEIKQARCSFYAPEDLAYRTVEAWNEVTIERKNPTNGERMMPDCIICFDGNINEASKRFAKTLKLPIVNIDRKSYRKQNLNELVNNRNEFFETLSLPALKEVFYRTVPDHLIDRELPKILDAIQNNSKVDVQQKQKCLDFLDARIGRVLTEEITDYSRLDIDKNSCPSPLPDKEKIRFFKTKISFMKKSLSEQKVQTKTANPSSIVAVSKCMGRI